MSEQPRYVRKIIRIRAVDSPNCRLALAEISVGKEPSHRILVPGVLTYEEYLRRRATWDAVRQVVGLDAEFWEGKDTLLFPAEWLNNAHDLARYYAGKETQGTLKRKAKGMGIDPAEGGDDSTWAIVDELGLLKLISMKTPDTTVIPGRTIALMKEWNLSPSQVCIDLGGGKVHADNLKRMGYPIRTVAFGAPVPNTIKSGRVPLREKQDVKEQRYAYVNQRAKMYHDLRLLLDPSNERPIPEYRNSRNEVWIGRGFGLPAEYAELRRQMGPIPLLYDHEGRIYMLAKTKKGVRKEDMVRADNTLYKLIGCSPDECDALALSVCAMAGPPKRLKVGGFN